MTNLDRVSIGEDLASAKVKAVVLDLDAYRPSQAARPFDGILGGTFLKSHIVTIDYAGRVIYIHSR
jgi:hypothetical protein